jgi:GNAT superfamily N-acetyltransferase
MLPLVLIRPYRNDDAIPPITGMLHAAYARLAEMGLRYTATYQSDEVTLRRLQRGFPFVAEADGEIVATVTLYPSDPESSCAWYRRPEVFSFGQFGVRPDWQGRGLGSRLLRLMEDEARTRGAGELALDTAQEADHLRGWYGRCGFREVEQVDWSSTNYLSVILSKTLNPSPTP